MRRCVSALLKRRVAASQRWCCNLCGDLLDEYYEVDHIIPLSLNGSNKITNLQALCPLCHRRKTFAENTETAASGSTSVCGCGKIYSSYFTCCTTLRIRMRPILLAFRHRLSLDYLVQQKVDPFPCP